MKRNKVMRAASAILVLAVLTTCIFSGTMAKYIISDGVTDSARVAKFGVVVNASGDLFGQSYMAVAGGNTVQAWAVNKDTASINATDQASGINIVAPGTKNDKGMTFAISGTPEVSTSIVVDALEGNGTEGVDDADFVNTDIYLKQGVYSIMVKILPAAVEITTDNMTDFYKLDGSTFVQLANSDFTDGVLKGTVTPVYKRVFLTGGVVADGAVSASADVMTADYYPIDWKVASNGAAAVTVNGADVMSTDATKNLVGTVANALTGSTGGTKTATPNVALDKTVTVTWEWIYTDGAAWADGASDTVLHNWENTTLRDLEDTTLGELITRAAAFVADDNTNDTDDEYLMAQGLNLVKYAEIDASASSANKVIVAYTGATAPTSWNAANVACLTAGFGARVTVAQVD